MKFVRLLLVPLLLVIPVNLAVNLLQRYREDQPLLEFPSVLTDHLPRSLFTVLVILGFPRLVIWLREK